MTTKHFLITDELLLPAIVSDRIGQDFAFDVETTGLNPRTDRLCGLALTFADECSYYLVFQHTALVGEEVVLQQHIPLDQFVRCMQPLFAQEGVTMVAHNAKFDLHFLSAVGLHIRGRLADTMLAAQLINENREVGLKALAPSVGVDQVQYQTLAAFPGYGKNDFLGVPLGPASTYAMNDTLATWRLWQRYRTELAVEGVDAVFRDVWMPLLVTLQQMEAKGIALDLEKVEHARIHYQQEAKIAEAEVVREGLRMIQARYPDVAATPPKYLAPVIDLYPDIDLDNEDFIVIDDEITLPIFRKANKAYRPRTISFKPGSTDHLGELLYDHYGLSLPRHLKVKQSQNGKTVSKDALDVMIHEFGDDAPPVLHSIMRWRKAEKFIGTYLDRFIEDADPANHNAIYTSFNQHITDTGRLSSSGPNLQNIPSRGPAGKDARNMFVARPGMTLVVADYSMMELRMLAHFSQDEQLLGAFLDGKDLHILTGANQANLTYDALKERVDAGDPDAKQLRSIGKTSNFGLTYGMGAKKYQLLLLTQNQLEVTEQEAQRLIDAYNTTFAGATLWKERVMRYSKKVGYVQTILGRKRRLPGLYSQDRYEIMRSERMGVNAVIQGSCADVISQAMPAIQTALSAIGGYILLQVHDELVCEVPEEQAEAGRMIVGTLMTTLINPKLRCPMVADAHTGKTWGEAKG